VLLRDIWRTVKLKETSNSLLAAVKFTGCTHVYNDRIGLKEWANEQGEPLPEYRNKMLFRGNVKVG
jgi:hypothetical protein